MSAALEPWAQDLAARDPRLDDLAARAAEVPLSAWAQAGLVTALACVAALPLVWFAVRRLVPGRNIVFARWGFSHVGLAALAIAGGSWLASLVHEPGTSLLGDLLLGLVGFLAAIALIAAWAVRLDPDGVRGLGLRTDGNLRAILAGLLVYAVTLPGILGLMPGWMWFLEWTGRGFQPQDVAARFAELDPAARALPLVLGIAVYPLCEEILFRAFLQPLLVQNMREVAGVGLTSAVFAALHGLDVFLPIFALSCVLGAIMLRTQRLAAVWIVHALHNGLMFALLSAHPELASRGSGP